MKKYGKWIRVVGFIAMFLVMNGFLNSNLIQSSVTRLIVHDMVEPEDVKTGEKIEAYDCVFFGQSHTTYGVNSSIIQEETGMTTTNASIGGEYARDMYYLALEMFSHYTPEMVVLDIDFGYLENVPYEDNTVNSMLVYNNYPMSVRKLKYAIETLPNRDFRAALYPWMNYRDNYDAMNGIFWLKRTDEYKNYDISAVTQIEPCDTYKGNGFLYRDRSFQKQEIGDYCIWWNEEKIDTEKSPEYIRKIVELCKEKGTQVVMISDPVNYEVATSDRSCEEFQQASDYIENLAKENDLTYYNFSLMKQSILERDGDDFWDADGHMYGDIAEEYSKVLGGFLKRVRSGEQIQTSEYNYKDIHEMRKHELNKTK